MSATKTRKKKAEVITVKIGSSVQLYDLPKKPRKAGKK